MQQQQQQQQRSLASVDFCGEEGGWGGWYGYGLRCVGLIRSRFSLDVDSQQTTTSCPRLARIEDGVVRRCRANRRPQPPNRHLLPSPLKHPPQPPPEADRADRLLPRQPTPQHT